MNGGNATGLTHGSSASGWRPVTHQATASTSTHQRSARTARYTSGESTMHTMSACRNHSGAAAGFTSHRYRASAGDVTGPWNTGDPDAHATSSATALQMRNGTRIVRTRVRSLAAYPASVG